MPACIHMQKRNSLSLLLSSNVLLDDHSFINSFFLLFFLSRILLLQSVCLPACMLARAWEPHCNLNTEVGWTAAVRWDHQKPQRAASPLPRRARKRGAARRPSNKADQSTSHGQETSKTSSGFRISSQPKSPCSLPMRCRRFRNIGSGGHPELCANTCMDRELLLAQSRLLWELRRLLEVGLPDASEREAYRIASLSLPYMKRPVEDFQNGSCLQGADCFLCHCQHPDKHVSGTASDRKPPLGCHSLWLM